MELADGKLEKILNSPETMAKIAELAKELGRGEAEDSPLPADKSPADEDQENPAASVSADFGDTSPLTSALFRAAGSFRGDEKRIAMLKALKPLADGKGAETVDRAILAIRVAKAVKCILPEVGIL